MNTSNAKLRYAKKEKKDEFYTKYEDIENTCGKYSQYFADKTIYCNCDTIDSNFFKYFQNNFFRFKLRRLIATSYTDRGRGEFLEHDGVITNFKMLNSHGDFRSPECVKKLKQSDIVITNPPFSLFKEYIEQLLEHKKQFLIIGNQNAIIYNNVFEQIKDNKLFIYQGFIKSNIPLSLEEAAYIDGASRVQIFSKVVFPLVKPTTATLIILNALAFWNDYLLPSLVLGKKELFTLPLSTYSFYGTYSADYGVIMAALVLTVAPILVMYLLLQKQIISGVVAGAVKM